MMRAGNGVLLVFSVKERLTEHPKMYGFYIQKYSFHILKYIYDFSIPANGAFHKYKVFSSSDVKLVAQCPPELTEIGKRLFMMSYSVVFLQMSANNIKPIFYVQAMNYRV